MFGDNPELYQRKLDVYDSSQIDVIWYDLDKKLMEVRFLNGAAYLYTNVEPSVFGGLCMADSVGAHFNKIKGNLKNYKRL